MAPLDDPLEVRPRREELSVARAAGALNRPVEVVRLRNPLPTRP